MEPQSLLAENRHVAYNEVRMTTSKPKKRSVALAVVKRDQPVQVLLVQRPEDDEEFPGLWGLPAASLHSTETYEEALQRIGVQKLGVEVRIGDRIGFGRKEVGGFVLSMCLYSASLDRVLPTLPLTNGQCQGVTLYTSWRWGEPPKLEDAARRGSLCSRLLLDASSRCLVSASKPNSLVDGDRAKERFHSLSESPLEGRDK